MIPQIIPQPARLQALAGTFTLADGMSIAAAGEALPEAQLLAGWLASATGFSLPVVSSGPAAIQLVLDPTLQALGPEGYRLKLSPQGAELRAPAAAGLFYAGQTLRQLFPPQIFSSVPVAGVSWQAPCVEIEDQPSFGWRGAMLDVSRHFFPLEFVKKFIDLLAVHKYNTFHWHLTDDQGWRIEIKKYPRLTEVGAWRKQTLVGRLTRERTNLQFDGIPHGGFFSQAEIREVVEYARQRHIRVLPEIEIPGHAMAAIAAYPELGTTGQPGEVATYWGIHTYDVFGASESTFKFLEDVLAEVIELFPFEYVHVGGDEVIKTAWQESPVAQARMQELGLKDEHELQSYFIRRMEAFLATRGRRLIGWDEILEGGLAPNATVMSWRGEDGGIAAASAGHDVVMAPNIYTYFDYCQSDKPELEPLSIGRYVPVSKVYNYNPVPSQIASEMAHHVLGTQFQIWAEYIATPAHAEYMSYPRGCALAESAWTPLSQKNWESFTARLQTHLARLDQLGVNYRKLPIE